MSYHNPSFGFGQSQTEPSLEGRRPSYFEADDPPSVLDPAILEADIMQSPHSHSTQFRKDSFASNGVLSPPAENPNWEPSYAGGAPDHATSSGISGSFHDERNTFARHSISHPPNYRHQHSQPQWNMDQSSNQGTPTNGLEFMPPPHFETPHYPLQRTESAPHAAFSQAVHHPSHNLNGMSGTEQGFIPAPQVQTPMSPHSHQDWMALAAQEGDRRPMPKRMRPHSPTRNVVDLQRRDGIRKKNGRIDIPQERNIHTIDELIDRTTDEDMLKELKQQKRLLRNREAALASRQRKKKHTEDLEVKEKGYTQQISMLEKDLADMHLAHDEVVRDRQLLWQQREEAIRHMDMLQEEKRDLVMRHTAESSGLRRQIQLLTDQLEHGSAPAMSAAPSSTGFTDFNAEMEALNMNHDVVHDWDNFLANDLHQDGLDEFGFEHSLDNAVRSPKLEKKASTSTIGPSSKQQESNLEQPIASGLLFMLLLCGAFVASSPRISSHSDIPQMPIDVRRAAPTVLNNLLAEASSATNMRVQSSVSHPQDPGPSNMPSDGSRSYNMMDRVHQRLTVPSRQQEVDVAFSMTPAQYASMTEVPVHGDGGLTQPALGRRNLANVLASMERDNGKTKAEIYTRSLLWDQIPSDVVKQFREMVRDHDELEQQQRQQHHSQNAMTDQNDGDELGNMFTYKIR